MASLRTLEVTKIYRFGTAVQRRSFSTPAPPKASNRESKKQERDLQINTTKALLATAKHPIGSFTEQTWIEIEVNIELWCGDRGKRGLISALRLLERMVQEEEATIAAAGTTGSTKPVTKKSLVSFHVNTHTLNSIIDSWRIIWHTQGAEKDYLLTPRQMKQLVDSIEERCGGTLLHDVRTYTMIIDAMEAEGAYRDEDPSQFPVFADSLLSSLMDSSRQNVNLRPNLRTFKAVMEAWLASGSTETPIRLEALLQQMRQCHRAGWADVQPTITMYNLALHSWAVSDRIDAPKKTELLLQAMLKEDGMTPNMLSYQSVLTAWSRSDLDHAQHRAYAILQHLQESHLKGSIDVKPSVSCYQIALTGFIRRGLLDQAKDVLLKWNQVWKMTEDDDLALSQDRLHAAMQAIARAGHPGSTQLVEFIFEHFFALIPEPQQKTSPAQKHHEKFQPTTASFNCVLGAWKRNNDPSAPERCEAILRRMLELHKLGFEDILPDGFSVRQGMECWLTYERPDAMERAEALLYQMKQEGAMISETCYEVLLNHWSRSGEKQAPDHCQRLFDDLMGQYAQSQDDNLKPQRSVFIHVISALARSGRVAKARSLLDVATSPKFWNDESSTPIEYNFVLDGYARLGEAEQAEALLTTMEQSEIKGIEPNSFSYAYVLEAWSRSKDPNAPERAQALFDKLKLLSQNGHEHVRPTVFTYAAMMTVWARCLRHDSVTQALSLFHELIRVYLDGDTACKPTELVFNTLLDVLAKKGEASKAEKVLQHMVKANFFQPSCCAYSTVLSAWARSADQNAPERAQAIFDQLSNKYHETGLDEMKPNDFTYGSLIAAWGRSGRKNAATKAVSLLKEYMTEHRPKSNDYSACKMIYKQVLEACQNAGDGPLADKILHEMKQRGVEVDVGHYNCVLTAWQHSVAGEEAADRAAYWLQEMVQLYQEGNKHVKPTRSSFRAVLSTLAHSGLKDNTSKLLELIQLMNELEIVEKSDCFGYNFVLESYSRAGRGEEAETLLRSIVDSGTVKMELSAFHHVIKAWTVLAAPERAEAIFHWLQELNQRGVIHNCQPNSLTYSTIIQAWSRSKDPRAVSKVGALVKEMLEASLTPNESVYGSLIMSIAKSDLPNKHRRAKAVLNDMKSRGVEPDSFTQSLFESMKGKR